MSPLRTACLALSASFVLACGSPATDTEAGTNAGAKSDGGTPASDGGGNGGKPESGPDAGNPGGIDAGCVRALAPENAPRAVAVSHPFPSDGGTRDNRYELFTLASDGTLSSRNVEFRMGRASVASGVITFTPDGKVGLAPQDDGSIGVFRLEADGGVTVVQAAFAPGFSAGQVLMDPSGTRAWVTDFNVQSNGGGLYAVDIGCDGTLSNAQRVLPGNNASAAAWLVPGSRAVVASRSLGTSPLAQDLHLADLDAGTVLSSTTGFPDRDGVPPMVSVSADGRWVALPDNSYFVDPQRVAFFEVWNGALVSRQVLNITAPVGVAFSPFGNNGLLVQSDTADAYRAVSFNASTQAFSLASSPLTYTHGRPQLPGPPLLLERGALRGRVLVGELDSLRQLQFQPYGTLTDVSETPASGTGSAQIVGAIGVSP